MQESQASYASRNPPVSLPQGQLRRPAARSSTGSTAAIDAPEAAPVEAALGERGWRLTDILVTHHHADHTGGIAELKKKHLCRVIAPRKEASKIPHIDVTVREGDVVTVGSLVGRVLETPGHTAGHISYWFKTDKLAFVGDTLFSVGCGRILEGTPDMMWQSLLKIRNLPADTLIFCGHEYTAANVHFALTIEPKNTALARARGGSRAAFRAEEADHPDHDPAGKSYNPFLRADLHSVQGAIGMEGSPPAQVFGVIRARKDKF